MTARLGILGGTFDPVHVAHLLAAVEARHQLHLDRVILVVAGNPWQKEGDVVAPPEARFEMVQAAVGDIDGLEASRLELDRAGPTYTIDTVQELAAPDTEIFLIVGGDVASRLDGWHRADELRERVTLALVDRAETATVEPPGWRVERVTMPELAVSSTDIRDRLARGAPVDVLVPPAAIRVLRKHRLYTRPR